MIIPAAPMGVVIDHWIAEKRVEGQIATLLPATYRSFLERALWPAFGVSRLREVAAVSWNRVLTAFGTGRNLDTELQARRVMSQFARLCVRYGRRCSTRSATR